MIKKINEQRKWKNISNEGRKNNFQMTEEQNEMSHRQGQEGIS